MIGRTALALLIESKRDEEDPRVPPFNWGAVGFPREETPVITIAISLERPSGCGA